MTSYSGIQWLYYAGLLENGECWEKYLEESIKWLYYLGLLEKGEYREKYLEESIQADKKYPKLPPSFSKEFLTWVPVGYTLQVSFKITKVEIYESLMF